MSSQTVASETTDPSLLKELGLSGGIPTTHCVAYPEFSYDLYIPLGYRSLKFLPLAVLVHGSGRNSYTLRQAYIQWAEEQGCALLCPLFPMKADDLGDVQSYKFILGGNTRYDKVLLRMIDEVQSRYPRVLKEQFLLWGYSGGGQFVHRFAYLHPERLIALAVGAPGSITPLDDTADFPQGVKNLDKIFGKSADLNTLRHVPTLFLAGDEDTDLFYAIARGMTVAGGDQGRYGASIELESSWSRVGMMSSFLGVKGASHEEHKFESFVKAFFAENLSKVREEYRSML